MPIIPCSTRCFTTADGGHDVAYEILLDGVKYRCDAATLARLYDGVPPDELDLILVEDDDDD